MLIYHKTNGINVTTEVILGAKGSKVSHGSHVWDKHAENVSKLEDNGQVFVTGATHAAAVYEGYFTDRDQFSRYLEV